MTVQIYNIESLPKLCLDSVRAVLIFWINPEEGKENIHMLSRRKMNTFPDHKKFAHTARSLACFWCTAGGQKISERLRKNSDVFLVAHRVSISTFILKVRSICSLFSFRIRVSISYHSGPLILATFPTWQGNITLWNVLI